MRIGLVCPYDLSKPGGVQAQVLGLGEALRSFGDEVSVIGPGLPESVDGVDLGTSVTVPGNGSMMPISLDPRVRSVIRKASSGLDLLHIHEPLMPTVSFGALRAGPPVVATFHAAPERVAKRFYDFAGPYLARILGENVRTVTAVSETAAEAVRNHMSVVIVPNGLDVATMSTDQERTPLRVAFLGRDEPRKGLDLLLESWGDVSDAVPDAELVVMGASRGSHDVEWMGRVDDETKIQVLNSAAVLVAPNTGGESFGIVLVEAMAAGAAVLASDLQSFRDVGGEAVRYFRTGDVSDLTAKLVELLDDDKARSDLARRGRMRADQFDWDTVGAAYRAVYEKSLS
jgi:phosphatidylinositol alpha-mannosyltransferase